MQVEHKTENGTVIFVKLPDDAEAFTMNYRKLCYWFNNATQYSENYLIQEGNFKLIGLTSEITEEQAKMMVDECNELEFNGVAYNDYESTSIHDTTLDSFKSLMQHLQVYEVNPYEKTDFPGLGQYGVAAFNKWCDAESRTGKWIVLFKPND